MNFETIDMAFVFPGQGSQAVGMGRDLAAKFPGAHSFFAEADEILGIPFSKIMWDGPDSELNDTLNTQPALFVHSIAAFHEFQNHYPKGKPEFFAGHSLGQLSAITAAGSLSFADGLRLVRKRGELMKKAGDVNPGGMAAVLGLDIVTLDKVCADASTEGEIVQVANDNCPGQVVISGHKTALERAMTGAKAAGAKRTIPLAVSIAAHSPLMGSIQDEWNEAVNSANFMDAIVPVVGNVAASPLISSSSLRADVMAQMQSRVRWVETINLMVSKGVTSFIEVGSGSVLSGLIKRIGEGNITIQVGTPEDFENLK